MAEGSFARELLSRPVPERGAELTWLGQSSFVLRSARATLLIDPFLSPIPTVSWTRPTAPRLSQAWTAC